MVLKIIFPLLMVAGAIGSLIVELSHRSAVIQTDFAWMV